MEETKFQLTISSSARDAHELPADFEFLKLLGEGSYGKVVRCLKKDTNETVAVKLPIFLKEDSTEVSTMEKLMCLKLDQQNIIRFLGWFHTSCGKAMVFESLDISLHDFVVKRNCTPMLLSDVSAIIQQLAMALAALKNIGLIHTDIKADNVMMVDHHKRPLRVKLIDFGLAMDRSKAKQGTTMQVVYFRAPEIMLGLPFNEAIDVWSLGCLMFILLHGRYLFTGGTEYRALHDITALLGMPAVHLLRNGLMSHKYFTRTYFKRWRLKTHYEYWRQKGITKERYKTQMRFSFDDLSNLRLEKKNKSEPEQREQCVDLLKAMLRLDGAKRITPNEILSHPFITGGKHHSNINKSVKTKRTTQNPVELQPGVVLVRPAAAENMLLLDNKQEIKEEHPVALKEVENIPTDRCSPPPPATPPLVSLPPPATPPPATPPPSGVIVVQPAAAENTLQLDDEERAARFAAGLNRAPSVKDRDMTARTTEGTQKKPGQKKKNCIRRLFSWVKKTFGSCCTAPTDPDDPDDQDNQDNQDDQGHK